MLKLAVGYPWSSPFMFTDFADATLNMRHPRGWEVRYFRGAGWCPAKRHIHICEQALEWGAERILIIGTDQVHPEDMLERLIQRHDQGYEVVTALVPCRGYVFWQEMEPFQPMAWRFKPVDPDKPFMREYRGMALDSDMIEVVDPNAGEMQRINFIGSGVLMFHRDHLPLIRKPWFYETVNRDTMRREANMDCTFVWRLQQEANAQVWLDTTIKVKHCHVFQIDETFQDRFRDYAQGDAGGPICLTRPVEMLDELKRIASPLHDSKDKCDRAVRLYLDGAITALEARERKNGNGQKEKDIQATRA